MAFKDNNKEKVPYIHYIPQAKTDPNWPHGYNFELVENMEQLHGIFKNFEPGKSVMSLDLETNGLDAEKCFIVGVCLCFDGRTGYYIPINHYHDKYNLGKEGLDYIYSKLCEAKIVFIFNLRFDFRIMEYAGFDINNPIHKFNRLQNIGYDMSKVKYYDVAVGVWLADTNVKMPSLKWSSEHFLGIKQQTFSEVTDGVENFYYIEPEKCAFYAASDALTTYLLVPATIKYYQEAKIAGKLDNEVLYPLMHMEQEKIALNKELVTAYEKDLKDRIEELEKLIYKEIGYVLNINSTKQLGDALQRMGIDTQNYTATGQMQVGIELLEKMADNMGDNAPPVLRYYVEYKVAFKFLSSYIKVLRKEAEEKGFLRCNYKTQQVPTGRLASGKDEKNTFFSPINIQSIPKPHPGFFYIVDLHDRTLFDKKENIILGYKVIPVQYEKIDGKKTIVDGKTLYGEDCIGFVESSDPKLNARRAFMPDTLGDDKPDEWIWCAIDYSAQELRIPANLSREPVWMEAFMSGGDVHKSTAYTIWGKENYDKEKRKMAKGANFGILYGMTAPNLAERFNMSLAEGEEFYNKYKNALPTLFAWEHRIINKAKKDNVAYTYFSRPRRVRHYFKYQYNFAKRTVVNTTVQGTAADILRIGLLKLWKNMFNHEENKHHSRFLTTVHDEVDFAIRQQKVFELLQVAATCLRFSLTEWPVVIDIECSIGWDWGSIFPIRWDEEKKDWIPICA